MQQAYVDVITFVLSVDLKRKHIMLVIVVYLVIFLIVHKHCCSFPNCVFSYNCTLLILFSKFSKTYFYLNVNLFEFHGVVRQGAHLNLVL
jgi:hypothetical protein